MHREGHVGAALGGVAPVVFVVSALGFPGVAVLGAGGAVLGALLPDYDIRMPFVTHRGITHTVWFAGFVGLIGGAAGGLLGASRGLAVAAGLGLVGLAVGAIGVGSHVLADALTPMGVRPLAPRDGTSYSLDLVRAGNPVANYALLVLGSGVCLGGLLLGTWVHGVA